MSVQMTEHVDSYHTCVPCRIHKICPLICFIEINRKGVKLHWSRKLDWYSNFILIKSTLQYTHCITRHDIIGWNDLYITRWYQISNVDVIGFLSYSCAFCQESDGAVDWLQLMFSKAYLSPLSTRFYDRISSSFYKIHLKISCLYRQHKSS